MASNTGFKQQCPNCEAMVPIKDDDLIGKRIRCPKCNEPFRVEDPDGAAATTKTAKPAKSGAAKGGVKAKAAKRTPVEDDEDDRPKFKKKKGDSNKLLIGLGLAGVAVVLLVVTAVIVMNNNSTKPKTTTPPAGQTASRAGPSEAPKDDKPDKATPLVGLASLTDISNMLPNETQAVINLPMPVIRQNPLGIMMFRDNLGASTKDAGRMGFSLEDVERWIIALNFSDPVWYFHIVRTTKPVKLDVLAKTLQLKPAEGGPIQGQDYYVTPVNWAETAKMLPTYLKPSGEPYPAGSDNHPLYVRLHDPQTLVIADQYPMKRFLEVKGHFKEEAPLPADNAGGGSSPFGNFGGQNPGAGRGAPPGGGGRGAPPGGGPAGGGPGSRLPGVNPGGSSPPAAVSAGSYRTINPHLKQMLDRMEANSPYLWSLAISLEDDKYFDAIAALFFGFKGKLHTAGCSFQWKNDNKMVALASLECDSDQAASSLRQGLEKIVQPFFDKTFLIPPMYTFKMKRGREKADNPNGPGAGNPGGPRGGPPGGRNPGGPPRGGRPPGGPPGGNPNPGDPNQPDQPQEPPTGLLLHVDLTTQGKWMNLATDVNVKDEIRSEILQAVEPYLVRMQGEFEMAMARPNPHQLAAAALGIGQKEGQFPLGTTADRTAVASRAGRPWPPDQRVSWMAELLPYLGYDQVSQRIRRNQSWRDPENLTPASVLVPNFLAPGSLRSTWYVSYPTVEPELAATHFVGMAGVGLDAATYPPGHPDAGIFNYERRISLAGVPNKSKTIFMIQVPPSFHSPWIAGGGSTVRGVPETHSIQPFLNLNESRQRGTTVLLADGSVRWVDGKISDDVFKALCRVKGDKDGVNLSQLKPIPAPEEPEPSKVTTPTAPPTAPKAEEKKAAPPPAKSAAPAAPKPSAPPAATPPKAGAPPGAK